jgi:hypothetical protein
MTRRRSFARSVSSHDGLPRDLRAEESERRKTRAPLTVGMVDFLAKLIDASPSWVAADKVDVSLLLGAVKRVRRCHC